MSEEPVFKAATFSACAGLGVVILFASLAPSWLSMDDTSSWFLLLWVSVGYILSAEIIFYLTIRCWALPRCNILTEPPSWEHRRRDPEEHIRKTVSIAKRLPDSVYTVGRLLSGYFLMEPVENIFLENYHSFFAYVIYGKPIDEMDTEKLERVHNITAEVTKELLLEQKSAKDNLIVKPGFNPDVKHVRVTLEPISYVHKPLSIYAFKFFAWDILEGYFLRSRGFERRTMDGLVHWYREGQAASEVEARRAIVLFHGIAVGWSLYMTFLDQLDGQRDVILCNYEAIMLMSLQVPHLDATEYAAAVDKILEDNGASTVTLIGHSFGSAVISWCLEKFEHRVENLVLLDPVSPLLSFPDVCWNVFFRPPFSALSWGMRKLMVTELTVANTMSRHFWWYEGILWLEHLPSEMEVFVGLCGDDIVLNPIAIQEYVKLIGNPRHQACLWPGLQHNDAITNEKASSDVHQFLRYGHSSRCHGGKLGVSECAVNVTLLTE